MSIPINGELKSFMLVRNSKLILINQIDTLLMKKRLR